jgi:hypothetical protein
VHGRNERSWLPSSHTQVRQLLLIGGDRCVHLSVMTEVRSRRSRRA